MDKSRHKYRGPLEYEKERGSFDYSKNKKASVPQSRHENESRYDSPFYRERYPKRYVLLEEESLSLEI